MIPRKLCIKNFLSYGDTQEIDFGNHHLICLSGKNGHGKSALLDALTWALWGQARKISGQTRADQGLVRLGQRSMLVLLDFDLNGQSYRVRRELEISRGKIQIALDFGLMNASDTFMPLTDKTIRATQHKIDEILRLDFDSFINSAFLRQGQSNEFSKKAPRDRKEIFAAILGLTQFDTLKKVAFEKSREATTQEQIHKTIAAQLQQENSAQELLEQELTSIIEQLQACDQHDLHAQQTWQALEQKKQSVTTQLHEQQQLLLAAKQVAQQQQAATNELQSAYALWKLVHKKSRQTTDYQTLIAQKQAVMRHINQYQQQQELFLAKKETLIRLKQELHERTVLQQQMVQQQLHGHLIELERLRLEQENNQRTIEHLLAQQQEIKKRTAENKQQHDACALTMAQKEPLEHMLVHLGPLFEKRKAAYHEFVATGTWMHNELRTIEQKKQLVSAENDPSCPLCEQNLSATRRRFLRTKLDKQHQLLLHQTNRLIKVVKNLKPSLLREHEEIEKIKAEHATILVHQATVNRLHEEYKVYQLREKEIEAQLAQKKIYHQQVQQKIDACNQELETVRTTLSAAALQDSNTSAHVIAILEKELMLVPDNTAYQQAQTHLTLIERELHEYETFRVQAAQQTLRTQEIDKLCTRLKKIKHEHIAIQSQLLPCSSLSFLEKEIKEQEQLLKTRDQENRDTRNRLLEQKGSTHVALTKCKKIKIDIETQKQQAATAVTAAYNYHLLAQALGPDGIQALLIEQAIPEVEEEANRLLSKLTNNQAHLFIESLRDLKKGGVKETLDIKISDTLGIRPYEMFSGGEAFRIDFALRIALSKLVARRSGTTLQTLIIDEGFGSQDEEGLTHIMEAIHALQDDFAKVIIVSHLDALKEQFPVHFNVEKGPQGSIVRVIEQG